jgi:hypothetical protein
VSFYAWPAAWALAWATGTFIGAALPQGPREVFVPEGMTLNSVSLGAPIRDYGDEIRFGTFGDSAPVGPLYVRLSDSDLTITYEGAITPHFKYTLAESHTDLGVSYQWEDLLIER